MTKILPPKEMNPALLPAWTPEQRVYQDARGQGHQDQWMFPAGVAVFDGHFFNATATESEVRGAAVKHRLLPNLTQEQPMTETIQMHFHKAETKAEAVKPRRFRDFPIGEKVTRGNGVLKVCRNIDTDKHMGLCGDGREVLTPHDPDRFEWYLESDWINGRPREIAGEAMRKAVKELNEGDVFEAFGERHAILSQCYDRDMVFAINMKRGNVIVWDRQTSHQTYVVLGHVTFESAKGS